MTASGRFPDQGFSMRRRSLLLGGLGSAALVTLGTTQTASAQSALRARAENFDFEKGNFIRDLLDSQDPRSNPDVFAPMDVTLVEWASHLNQTAWFDAVAPYHPTAVGIITRIPRRPSSESNTNRNKNIAALHASWQLLKGVVPERSGFRSLLLFVGLNPDDESLDPTTPVGIGNLAGKGAVAYGRNDGMNMLGYDGGRKYNPRPFADYTGYEPVNTAYELINPSRWQPKLGPHRRRLGAPAPGTTGIGDKGIYTVQHFATAHMGRVKAMTFKDPGQFGLAPPEYIDHHRKKAYKATVDHVLEVSAGLTEEQKVKAELFDDKLLGISRSVFAAARANDKKLDLDGWVHLFATNTLAVFDSTVAMWHYKRKYDVVRPGSAIQHVYGHSRVTSWGGPGKGTVRDMPADQWASYLNMPDHPEYPSGSSGVCAAQAQACRRFLGNDLLDLSMTIPAGWTLVEPGVTPSKELKLHWSNWTDFADDCLHSRVWGGVHYLQSCLRSADFGKQFGDRSYDLVQRHIKGDVGH
ncbi:DUF6851 domain-containing protein [Actinomadura terrae]|uniref:DUF6851 domain-containing protein n=1 Tax=Actinomadura terrae TaxID=604353 RepID=UPI001FA7A422|nr:hypothetical protein [Actinomadura terrae]